MTTKGRAWSDIRRDAVAAGRIDPQAAENAAKLMREANRAHRLAEVRRSQGTTQKDVAALLQVSQARISKLESGELSRTEIGTLDAYVGALGGRLRVVADFGDHSITLE